MERSFGRRRHHVPLARDAQCWNPKPAQHSQHSHHSHPKHPNHPNHPKPPKHPKNPKQQRKLVKRRGTEHLLIRGVPFQLARQVVCATRKLFGIRFQHQKVRSKLFEWHRNTDASQHVLLQALRFAMQPQANKDQSWNLRYFNGPCIQDDVRDDKFWARDIVCRVSTGFFYDSPGRAQTPTAESEACGRRPTWTKDAEETSVWASPSNASCFDTFLDKNVLVKLVDITILEGPVTEDTWKNMSFERVMSIRHLLTHAWCAQNQCVEPVPLLQLV